MLNSINLRSDTITSGRKIALTWSGIIIYKYNTRSESMEWNYFCGILDVASRFGLAFRMYERLSSPSALYAWNGKRSVYQKR